MAYANGSGTDGKGSGMDWETVAMEPDWGSSEPAPQGPIERSMLEWATQQQEQIRQWMGRGMMWDELVLIARLWKDGIRPDTWENMQWELRAWDKTELQNVIDLLSEHIRER